MYACTCSLGMRVPPTLPSSAFRLVTSTSVVCVCARVRVTAFQSVVAHAITYAIACLRQLSRSLPGACPAEKKLITAGFVRGAKNANVAGRNWKSSADSNVKSSMMTEIGHEAVFRMCAPIPKAA